MADAPLLLALDPSLRCTGWLLLTCDGAELVDAGALVTEPETTKKDYLAQRLRDDMYRAYRVAQLVDWLVWHQGRQVAAVAMELPSGVPHSGKRGRCKKCGALQPPAQDAQAYGKLTRVQQAVCVALNPADTGLRPILVSVYAAKEAATGEKRPEDGKAAVARGVKRRWPAAMWKRVLTGVSTKQEREAVYDAAAVALVALHHPAVRLAADDHQRALEPAARRTG